MPTDSEDATRRLALRLRTALVLLATAVALGAAAELAMLRHWHGWQQLVPWVVVGLLGLAAAALLLSRPTGSVVAAARVVGALTATGSAYGVLIHVLRNFQSGPLDARYAESWDGLPWLEQVWLASTGGVGPAPSLAPGMLALGGVCLVLGTLGRSSRPAHRDPAQPAAVSVSRSGS